MNRARLPAASFIAKTLTRLDRMKQTRQKEQPACCMVLLPPISCNRNLPAVVSS
jgi:hypothetical protein